METGWKRGEGPTSVSLEEENHHREESVSRISQPQTRVETISSGCSGATSGRFRNCVPFIFQEGGVFH